MKIIVTFSRILTGLVFVFSGFVKAIDPVGTQIKFSDYFEAMGLAFLMPYALIFSFLLNAAELTVGLMLLFNVFSKFASWAGLFFLILFTPLTLWLAIANPVTDCGCFGDAVKLTNWQTFWKNVILFIFILIIFFYREKYGTDLKGKKNLILFSLFILFSFAFQFYNFYNLPIIDFRPLKEGTNIKDAISYPPDAEKDVYETDILYKNLNTGKSKAFDINSIPYQDTLNWVYDTTMTKLIKKGYEPPVHDFFLSNLNGRDITEDILNDKRISCILIIPDLEKGIKRIKNYKQKLADIAFYTDYNHYKFYCFTSSETRVINQYKNSLPPYVQILTGDYKMLKTFIRSNPGFVILKDGIILKK
ncbi:MAG: DoxX family protein, partial [Bacteroidetes bacterium]